MDPFPIKEIYGEEFTPEKGLPVFRIGPLKGCTHDKAIEQCCWLECTYYMFDEVAGDCYFSLDKPLIPKIK